MSEISPSEPPPRPWTLAGLLGPAIAGFAAFHDARHVAAPLLNAMRPFRNALSAVVSHDQAVPDLGLIFACSGCCCESGSGRPRWRPPRIFHRPRAGF